MIYLSAKLYSEKLYSSFYGVEGFERRPETPRTSQHSMVWRGLRGALIMLKCFSLSDRRWLKFQPGHIVLFTSWKKKELEFNFFFINWPTWTKTKFTRWIYLSFLTRWNLTFSTYFTCFILKNYLVLIEREECNFTLNWITYILYIHLFFFW